MITYDDISKEVGHVGYRPYPTVTEAESLWRRLAAEPSIDDFKEALCIYRFAPVANTLEERNVIQIIDRALAEGKQQLSLAPTPVKKSHWRLVSMLVAWF